MLYHGITVEHSYNCMVLLCRPFLGLSGHYNKKEWKPLGTVHGGEIVNLPDEYNELYIIVNRQPGQNNPLKICYIVPRSAINVTDGQRMEAGSGQTICQVLLTQTYCRLEYINNATSTISSCDLSVYYR